MTSLEFITKLSSVNERREILEVVCTFINDFSVEYNKDEISAFIESISEDEFTSFGNKLGWCRRYCLEELKETEAENKTEYLQSLRSVEKILSDFSAIYQNIAVKVKEEKKVKEAEELSKNLSDAIRQNSAVLAETRNKVEEFRKDLKTTKDDIEKVNKQIETSKTNIDETKKNIDEKIFSLLINTVAILGIFVAIAFAGLGITSLFSDLDFATAFASKENFIRTVFFLFLVALLSYNLLLLMVYFVFKLSRPILIGSAAKSNDKQDENKPQRFLDNINLTPFFVVDGILFVVIIALFVWGIFTYNNDDMSDSLSLGEESYTSSILPSDESNNDSETDSDETQ